MSVLVILHPSLYVFSNHIIVVLFFFPYSLHQFLLPAVCSMEQREKLEVNFINGKQHLRQLPQSYLL